MRCLGRAPKSVCAAYVLACAAEMRCAGVPAAEVADALGYADAATLLRTLRQTAPRRRGGLGDER